jgi:hypothetical protein
VTWVIGEHNDNGVSHFTPEHVGSKDVRVACGYTVSKPKAREFRKHCDRCTKVLQEAVQPPPARVMATVTIQFDCNNGDEDNYVESMRTALARKKHVANIKVSEVSLNELAPEEA